ncbi:hypothetical protein COCMIDRAFT_29197 [Bipolaris oryzae ATCC 44560]|uniref:Uncharacterized protein n=1 Tax=Bipolaris oryzae ATCC 44560 TaxID=930090 RepID=W6YRP2_COCMI|nr:uncharacterized protein COCMIDRAFT_29197 [Bipolaris oryzae ATCC 44560]EUC42122.1 hypothetical protein COCMIDRAFT_29197 [Bipolaris oryzae ATCC 44560]
MDVVGGGRCARLLGFQTAIRRTRNGRTSQCLHHSSRLTRRGLLGGGQQAPQVAMAQVSVDMDRGDGSSPQPSTLTPTGAMLVQTASSRAGQASHGFLSAIRGQVSAPARDGVEPVKKDGWGEGRICLGNVQPAHVSTRLGWAGRPFHRIRTTVLNWAEGHPDDGDGPLIGDEGHLRPTLTATCTAPSPQSSPVLVLTRREQLPASPVVPSPSPSPSPWLSTGTIPPAPLQLDAFVFMPPQTDRILAEPYHPYWPFNLGPPAQAPLVVQELVPCVYTLSGGLAAVRPMTGSHTCY